MNTLPPDFRFTKIIATLGPASQSADQMRRLISAGVDIFRLNMAHADAAWVNEIVPRIREVATALNHHVAVMMDVKGPEIRTGDLVEPINLQTGDRIRLIAVGEPQSVPSEPSVPREFQVSVSYPALAKEVPIGGTVLVASGMLRLRVIEKDPKSLLCEVQNNATLTSRRHINLPGIEVNLPALTEKDIRDLKVGVEAGIDFVALSFVRRAADVHELKGFLNGAQSKAQIIAKIEDEIGLRNFREIALAADAIMVARGDLGIEIDYHRLPIVQREMVETCLEVGKPVIIATQLLESMMSAPMPTRAEISDVSNAIREQADAVMLSGETTVGQYPVECVEVLRNIIASIQPTLGRRLNERIVFNYPKTMMLRSAAVLAQQLNSQSAGIVVFTRSGFMASKLAALRALNVPVFAFTDVETTCRQLSLPWGLMPFRIEFSPDPDQTISTALDVLRQNKFCRSGDWLVVVTHVLANGEVIETMQLRQV